MGKNRDISALLVGQMVILHEEDLIKHVIASLATDVHIVVEPVLSFDIPNCCICLILIFYIKIKLLYGRPSMFLTHNALTHTFSLSLSLSLRNDFQFNNKTYL